MNKVKQLYRDFFGLTEQSTPTTGGAVKMPKASKPEDIKKLTDKGLNVQLENADMVDEATLDNSITEYRGGVQWVLIDPANAKRVMQDISQWAQKKGFTIIKRNISKSGKVGYIYFRLGDDPAKESQRIQGYVAQSPDIKHFRFKVLGEKPTPPQAPTPENI